jgi:arylsulfatase A-like enzyme
MALGSRKPPIRQLRPPPGAPNVLVVLLDDVGFGASSAFGGPVHAPTAERLAGEGLRYTRFHTTALCSPTRAALITGRNHHSVGMGGITEMATSAPGYSSVRPNTCAPIAEILKLNGYATAHLGKCHEVPVTTAPRHDQPARNPRAQLAQPLLGPHRPGRDPRQEFAYDGGGLAKGGTVTLYLDGNQIGAGRVEQTEGSASAMSTPTSAATPSPP